MESLKFPGEVFVDTIKIISHSGKEIDVSGLAEDVVIFEDMFATTSSGYIVINDAVGLIDSLPMIGQELLSVSYRTPTLSERIVHTFYIYKMTVLSRKFRSAAYSLNFCSTEQINSLNNTIAKSFNGEASTLVSSIFKDERYLGSDKTLYTERTKNNIKFIAPYWSPLETINWLSTRAVSVAGDTDFIFYQDREKYNFRTISSLLKGETKRDYVFGDVDSATSFGPNGDYEQKYRVVELVEDQTTFDYMRIQSAGANASYLYTFDVTTRAAALHEFDYLNDFDSSSHLNKYPLRSSELKRSKKSNFNFVLKNEYVSGRPVKTPFDSGYLKRAAIVSLLNTVKINVKTYGRTDMKVGDVVKFSIPDNRQIGKESILSDVKSDYYSGRYLVTAIRHQFKFNQHSMHMELVNDSFNTRIE